MSHVYQLSASGACRTLGAQGIAGWEKLQIGRRVYQTSTTRTFKGGKGAFLKQKKQIRLQTCQLTEVLYFARGEKRESTAEPVELRSLQKKSQ